MVRQLRFRTVVLVVRLSAAFRKISDFRVAVLIKWLKKT